MLYGQAADEKYIDFKHLHKKRTLTFVWGSGSGYVRRFSMTRLYFFLEHTEFNNLCVC